MAEKKLMLWSNKEFEVFTPTNPHVPLKEGLHIVLLPRVSIASGWVNPELCAKTFKVAAKVCQIMEKLRLAPWFNLQANGNWHFLTGQPPRFHVHIYARRKGKTWGMPVQLPLSPEIFRNKPMTEKERKALSKSLNAYL